MHGKPVVLGSAAMHVIRMGMVAAVLALAGCGGGGGGNGSGPPAASGSITLDTTSVSVSASTADPAPSGTVTVSISLTGSSSPGVTATTTSNGVASVSVVVNSASKATVSISFKAPSTLAPATYDDTVTIKACTDSGCSTPLTGSPASVTTHYTVTKSSVPAGSFFLDSTSVTVSAAADAAAPVVNVGVTASLTGAGSLNLVPTSTSIGISTVSAAVGNPAHGSLIIQFKSPASLGVGTFDDTVTLKVCADAACTRPLTGSPASIPVHYTVTAGSGGAATVKINGTVTFDKVPGNANGIGLNYGGTVQAPARGVLVEAVNTSDRSTVAASTSTDATGAYSLMVPANTGLFLRVKAEMLRTGTPAWHYRVLDNTNSNALYAVTGADFNSGTSDSQHDLNAPSGWGGGSYTATRAAAPFAILDTVYQATSLVQGASPNAIFPALDLFWSVNNIPNADNTFNPATGEIQTTQFNPADASANPPTGDVIYILGDANTDTDEYDASVIAHEWGHYFQDSFSRDDSFGGIHRGGDRLDMRVAFSEGWGDGFSGMATNRSIYQDSNGSTQAGGDCLGLQDDTQFPACAVPTNPGWYSEAGIARVLWHVFDSASHGAGNVGLGFGPVFTVMNGEMVRTRSLTSIYPFAAALKIHNPAVASGIDAVLNAQDIAVADPAFDEWGTGETNDAGDPSILPLYLSAAVPGTVSNVCSNNNFDINHDGNKIGESKFLKFTLAADRTVTIKATRASGPASTDPDLQLFGAGWIGSAETTTNNSETLTMALVAGTYVVEVYEYANTTSTPKGLTCFNVSLN